MNHYESSEDASGLCFAVVVSRFNEMISVKLLDACSAALIQCGARSEDIDIAWVPGAFEIPITARALASSGRYDALVTLGSVIRGGTPHFDYVAGECVRGVAGAARKHGVPVGFGILTVDTIEQAIERAGTKAGNKGEEATLAVIEMVNLLRRID